MQQAPDYGSIPSGNDLKTKAELDEQKDEKNATMLETALQGRGTLRRRETRLHKAAARAWPGVRVRRRVRVRSSERPGRCEELASGGWRRRCINPFLGRTTWSTSAQKPLVCPLLVGRGRSAPMLLLFSTLARGAGCPSLTHTHVPTHPRNPYTHIHTYTHTSR